MYGFTQRSNPHNMVLDGETHALAALFPESQNQLLKRGRVSPRIGLVFSKKKVAPRSTRTPDRPALTLDTLYTLRYYQTTRCHFL